MSLSLFKSQQLKRTSSLLPYIWSLYFNTSLPSQQERICTEFIDFHHPRVVNDVKENWVLKREFFHSQRYSTVSALCKPDPDGSWLNVIEGSKEIVNKDGTFLVLAGNFLEDDQIVGMFEKAKLIQQRFPHLQVIGQHCGGSGLSDADQTQMVELVMKEFITFPIFLSCKNFSEMENEACYLLYKDMNSIVLHEKGLDLGRLNQEIEALNVPGDISPKAGNSSQSKLKCTWAKPAEVLKEPHLSSSLQNLLLHFPGCVTADEIGDRLFVSDSNHHRIIIFDGDGKILDCIGSSPGFEDGEFESAKLARPAGLFYDDADQCLYIVDSENHAIRRADMERRVLETLYPTYSIKKKDSSMWTWIADRLGFGKKTAARPESFDPRAPSFPWHLLKSDNDFLLINHSFVTLWVMDSVSGEIRECIKGFPKILEAYGELIIGKASVLEQMPSDWLKQQVDARPSHEKLPYSRLLSSVTNFQNHIVACDTAASMVFKLNPESGAISKLQFSNFGILGLPYWLSFPLESAYSLAGFSKGPDHLQHFSLLPGRIDMRINVDIPEGATLVEPLQEGCIWRQARGSATEVLGANGVVGFQEKIGVAQQWYVELDNLAFSQPEPEIVEDDSVEETKFQDGKIQIDCAVNASPGTSEVIVSAPLYLKLRTDTDLQEKSREKDAARIADIMNPGTRSGIERDSCIQILLKSKHDLRSIIFVKPLLVRIKLDCLDHPKAQNKRDIILTDSSVEVNVSLNS